MKTNIERGVMALAAVLAFSIPINSAIAKVAVIQAPSPALVAGSSFAWEPVMPRTAGEESPVVDNDIVEARLRMAIETALIARGYQKASSPADADLVVSYRLSLQEQQDLSLEHRGICAPRFGCATGGYDLHEERYTQGKLILDLKERQSGVLVWRAMSDKRVKAKDASQERLNKAMMTMTKSLAHS